MAKFVHFLTLRRLELLKQRPATSQTRQQSMPRRTTEADEDSVRVAASAALSAALAGVCSGGSRMPEAKACLLFGFRVSLGLYIRIESLFFETILVNLDSI